MFTFIFIILLYVTIKCDLINWTCTDAVFFTWDFYFPQVQLRSNLEFSADSTTGIVLLPLTYCWSVQFSNHTFLVITAMMKANIIKCRKSFYATSHYIVIKTFDIFFSHIHFIRFSLCSCLFNSEFSPDVASWCFYIPQIVFSKVDFVSESCCNPSLFRLSSVTFSLPHRLPPLFISAVCSSVHFKLQLMMNETTLP